MQLKSQMNAAELKSLTAQLAEATATIQALRETILALRRQSVIPLGDLSQQQANSFANGPPYAEDCMLEGPLPKARSSVGSPGSEQALSSYKDILIQH